jgi:8-oxo-dGTP pyrophosphatase MutT (NUDIX family)
MNIAGRLREALEIGRRGTPELIAGDGGEFLDRGEAPAPAAVLVAVVDRPEPGVILTVRPETMRRHAGQVAFPGGRIDPGDDGPVAAALREAQEEIALPPASVEVIGTADSYRTITGYLVTPVLGVVPPDLPLRPEPLEVAAIFEAPLHFLLDPARHALRSAFFRGETRHYYEIDWQGRRIWGATAAMIVNLSRRLVLTR